jgi:hypothetical protein
MNTPEYPIDPTVRALIERGENLHALVELRTDVYDNQIGRWRLPSVEDQVAALRELRLTTRRWLNEIRPSVETRLASPGQVWVRADAVEAGFTTWIDLVKRELVKSAAANVRELAAEPILQAIFETIEMLRAIPAEEPFRRDAVDVAQSSIPPARPNTAFILMWMDPDNDDLEDVLNAYRETCKTYGIRAVRADEIEHQDVITQVVLDWLRSAEFLIGDLSGERPNVYYEIGYAHAIGKRPILYRKKGTRLHFDLSVHNVPEYRNESHLRKLVGQRLEAMTGRIP